MSTSATMMGLKDPPALDIDPFSEENLRNPYPFFEQLREAGPVAYIKSHGYYAVGRFEEAAVVATDNSRFCVAGGIGLSDVRKPGALRPKSPISEVDPPEHSAVRGALQKIMSPLVVRQWREEFIREAEIVAAAALAKGEVDGVGDIIEAFVLSAFPRIVGIDVPTERLIITGELNFNQLGPDNALLQQALKRAEPIMAWYSEQLKRDKMLPGGFGEKIYQAEDRAEFAAGTAEPHVRSFFRAGVDTTIAGIGITLNQLAQNPEQFALLKKDPSKIRNAFEEGIRFEAPAQVLFRTTTGEVEFSGYRLKADTKIAYYPGAANRDPRKWDDPDRFDITRDVLGNHLAFGAGTHVCIGQMIARLEAEAILGAIIKRAKAIEPTGEPSYKLINTLRTLETLPLRIIPE